MRSAVPVRASSSISLSRAGGCEQQVARQRLSVLSLGGGAEGERVQSGPQSPCGTFRGADPGSGSTTTDLVAPLVGCECTRQRQGAQDFDRSSPRTCPGSVVGQWLGFLPTGKGTTVSHTRSPTETRNAPASRWVISGSFPLLVGVTALELDSKRAARCPLLEEDRAAPARRSLTRPSTNRRLAPT